MYLQGARPHGKQQQMFARIITPPSGVKFSSVGTGNSYLFAFWVIFHDFCRLLNFFKMNFFKKFFKDLGRLSECQTVLIHIRPTLCQA